MPHFFSSTHVKRSFNRPDWSIGAYVAIFLFVVLAPRNVLPSCPIHSSFGLLCPGCGMTRAVKALCRGQIGNAVHDNALLFLFPVLLALGFYSQKIENERVRKRSRAALVGATLLLVLTFTMLRNFPDSRFAPIQG